MPDLVSFKTVAGVPIHYARQPVAEYGTIGKARTVRLDRGFLTKLEACLTELWQVCQLGPPVSLVSAGCYVAKTGRHSEGRAIDIDSLWWVDEPPLVTLRAPDDAKRYLGTEAIIRRHFGTVLGWWYNRAHQDHWHIDDGSRIMFNRSSKSRVLFVQSSLVHVLGRPVVIDGVWGPETRGMVHGVLEGLDTKWSTFKAQETWLVFLKAVALVGWGVVEEPGCG